MHFDHSDSGFMALLHGINDYEIGTVAPHALSEPSTTHAQDSVHGAGSPRCARSSRRSSSPTGNKNKPRMRSSPRAWSWSHTRLGSRHHLCRRYTREV
jgi:hypothetical protein